MLTTTGFQPFGIEIFDTTVTVLGGLARIGNTLMPFQGGQITFSDLAGFTISDSSKYRNSILYLQNIYGAVDMTHAVSNAVSTPGELTYPDMIGNPGDNTSYLPGYPVGLFTFFSPDGIQADMTAYYSL
jgi:hypothetical protein